MPDVKKIATRESYGRTLAELGKEHDDIVVLDADLAASTKTAVFASEFPDRFIDCGIAEANMIGVAAGMALSGKTPFCSSFAMFAAGRAFEQIRNSVGYPHLNVKIGASHAGITVGEDGATHQCVEDIALMRTIPGMVIMNPGDDVEAEAAVRAAYEIDGPVYLRLGRLAVPVINDRETYKFEVGKGTLLHEGNDVTLVATGLEVAESVKAVKILEEKGISAELINICTIKPLDTDLIVSSAAKTKKVVTIEEHSIIGGLGGAVAEALAENYPVKMHRIGIRDRFGESGPALELMHKFMLDGEGIASQVIDFLQ
jgi:transketolase